MSRQQRKKNRTLKYEGYAERRATRSKYAAKAFEREHGRPPDPEAEAKAKVKVRER